MRKTIIQLLLTTSWWPNGVEGLISPPLLSKFSIPVMTIPNNILPARYPAQRVDQQVSQSMIGFGKFSEGEETKYVITLVHSRP